MKKAPANPNMRIAKRVFALLVLLFLLLFAGKLVYNLTAVDRDYPSYYFDYGEFFSNRTVNNFVSNTVNFGEASTTPDFEQKYERIASLEVKSLEFDADLEKSQAAIEAHRGLVQMENSGGLEGERRVQLTIGVRPEAFDALREELAQIGRVVRTDIVTRDMTNEYLQLFAEKESLTRRLEHYEALQAQGGSLQDQLALELKLMEADGELQKILVRLGEYSGERALCTVDFTLTEGRRLNLGREMEDAVVWAAGVFAVCAGIALLAVLTSLAVAALWNYMKHLGQKSNDEPKA